MININDLKVGTKLFISSPYEFEAYNVHWMHYGTAIYVISDRTECSYDGSTSESLITVNKIAGTGYFLWKATVSSWNNRFNSYHFNDKDFVENITIAIVDDADMAVLMMVYG